MNQDARKRKKGRRIFLPLPNYYLVLSSLTFDFLFSVSPLPTFISSAPVHLFFQTANTAVHDSAYLLFSLQQLFFLSMAYYSSPILSVS